MSMPKDWDPHTIPLAEVPAPTAETRVEWTWWFAGDWIKGRPFNLPDHLGRIRASVNGGPARTPGEWLTILAPMTMADEQTKDEAYAVLRDLLGDG